MIVVFVWWLYQCFIGIYNIKLWKKLYHKYQKFDNDGMIGLCGLYVFGCFTRCLFPKSDVERYTLIDSWISSVFVGRSIATIAEISFVYQWEHFIDNEIITSLVVFLIYIAEICSWYGVLTLNFMGNIIEESLWTASFFIISITMFIKGKYDLFIGTMLYVMFMVYVDVPMYISRLGSLHTMTIYEGFIDCNLRREVTWDFNHWKEEIPWQTAYFTFAVWTSLYLTYKYCIVQYKLKQ